MPRYTLASVDKSAFISPSQEEALEAIEGWDDSGQEEEAGINDFTPSQVACLEASSPNSLEGGGVRSPPEEAVEGGFPPPSSPPRPTGDASTMQVEDSYREAYESDRDKSPSRRLSWSLAAAGKDSKSPASISMGVEKEVETLVLDKADGSNRPSTPAEAAVTSGLRTEPELDEENAEEISRRSAGFPIHKPVAAAAAEVEMTAAVEVWPTKISSGVQVGSPLRSSPPGDTPQALKPSSGEGFGSGNESAFMNLRRKGNDSPQRLLGERLEHLKAFGLESGGGKLRSQADDTVLDALNQMVNSVQIQMKAVEKMVVEDNQSGKGGWKAGDYGSRKRLMDQIELGTPLQKVVDRGEPDVDIHQVENLRAAANHQSGAHVEVLSGKKPLSCPASSNTQMDSAAVDKRAVSFALENGSQHSPPSPPRPPRAVQEKLNRLRSQSGKKRDNSSDIFWNRSSKEGDNDALCNTMFEALKLRSRAEPVADITAAELLKTALEVGITLPGPFHKNYFD